MAVKLSKLLAEQRAKASLIKSTNKARRNRPTEPLWKGPQEDGITNSLLGRFLVCRERFRLQVVEGLRPETGFNVPLEFGNMWHEAEEAHCRGRDPYKAMNKMHDKWRANHPGNEEVRKQYFCCKTAFPIYLKYWEKHQDEVYRKPVLEEKEFRIRYELPSGRYVTLRGKFDAIFLSNLNLILQENKTKTKIDHEGIGKTLHNNIQTMIYLVAMRHALKQATTVPTKIAGVNKGPPLPIAGSWDLDIGTGVYHLPKLKKNEVPKIEGVLYNVIKRPLGDLHAIKQRKGRLVKGKRIGAESETEFYKRLGESIEEAQKSPVPDDRYFHRWKSTLEDADFVKFQTETLDVILEQLLDWWEWIKVDPFNPWRLRKPSEINPDYYTHPPGMSATAKLVSGQILTAIDEPLQNKVHWQAPWGVYNSMFSGFRGDYFEYLSSDSTVGLEQLTTLYPELEKP
jgi:hypothetical protein